jgi:predicted nuclease of predicted toxin-antitoxin system
MTRKLLFDQNLSARIVSALGHEFTGSKHVGRLKLGDNSDAAVWAYAKENGFCIVSKDADFHQMSFLYGAPPKAIWIRLGNCSTDAVVVCIKSNQAAINAFMEEAESALLILN